MAKDNPKSFYKKTNPQNGESDDLPGVCSNCFTNIGLRLEAKKIGTHDTLVCKNCKSDTGHKLSLKDLVNLAHQFFVLGTCGKPPSVAPRIRFDEDPQMDWTGLHYMRSDVLLFKRFLKIGLTQNMSFPWEEGLTGPILNSRSPLPCQILKSYPSVTVARETNLYRVRINPDVPLKPNEYDSPPSNICRDPGRLDSSDLAALYASYDLSMCLHESRVTSEEELYFATLILNQDLKFLDLTHRIEEPPETEKLDSMNLTLDILFSTGKSYYPTTRKIALAAHKANYDGLIYPPCFKAVHSHIPLPQNAGNTSKLTISKLHMEGTSHNTQNLAIFGHPIQDGRIKVKCINKIHLNSISYGVNFGAALPPIPNLEPLENSFYLGMQYWEEEEALANRTERLELEQINKLTSS